MSRVLIIILFLAILFLPLGLFAQTVFFNASTLDVQKNTDFSLPLKITSSGAIFAISFDLDFNPALIQFVSATEGSFLNQGCQTSLMTIEDPPGKLIFGLTRLGASCGGVSGSGTLATLNFRSLGSAGNNSLTFSNNSMCVLNGSDCDFITGTWTGVTVNIKAPSVAPVIFNVSAFSLTSNSAIISWTTDKSSDSQVEYGLTSSYGQQTGVDFTLTNNHTMIINNLNAGAIYHFRVRSKDAAGLQAVSLDSTFTVPAINSACPSGGAASRPSYQ